jgi:DNA polymerase-2
MAEYTGWLLDVYADPKGGLALWLLGEDGVRHHLQQDFPVTFYASGPNERLRQLWKYLQEQEVAIDLQRAERRDLFQPQPLTVLAVQVRQPSQQPPLFFQAANAFPDLTFYDADIPPALRHAAQYATFPLAHCHLQTDERGNVQSLQVLDSPWDLDPEPPPLRILALQPDVDPAHANPRGVLVGGKHISCRLSLGRPRPLLVNLRAILAEQDPDLLVTNWGDTWLLPHLLALSKEWNIPLPLNRHAGMETLHRPERTYFAYGQVIYRGRQFYLFGRWHVDGCNAMMFHEYGMEGIFELSRVTALPVQSAARLSPGSGISAMQVITALRHGILVPWRKQQAEFAKSARDLVRFDQGGLVYQPTPGLHRDVAEIDFISMYPSIMRRFNISPETVRTPDLSLQPLDEQPPGLIPLTLAPLLDKRLAFKLQLGTLPKWDPRRQLYQARATAHKWLLVTCFGYLGYKNARFGRIEAHQAVTAYGREALLRAKEAAEDLGYSVLHMYVDGLWVRKDGADTPAALQPLLDEIVERTGLPIALDGIYRWVAFLPSRLDARVPVANRYFGCFQDGSLKCRGIEARRGDTPAWIVHIQMSMLEMLSQAPDAEALPAYLPEVERLLRKALADLRLGKVPLPDLLVSQKLSRELEKYRTPSPAARAAIQLAALGRHLRPGQRVRFIHTLGEPGVHAWDLPVPPDPRSVDVKRYQTLLLRAASSILQPLGIQEQALSERLLFSASPLTFLVPRRPGICRTSLSMAHANISGQLIED